MEKGNTLLKGWGQKEETEKKHKQYTFRDVKTYTTAVREGYKNNQKQHPKNGKFNPFQYAFHKLKKNYVHC